MKTKTRVSEIDIEIGAKLREIRKISGMTQDTLAKQIDVSFQQVQKYEQGKNRLSLSKAVEIAKILKVSVLAFLPEEYSDKKNTLLIQENKALKQTLAQIEKTAHSAKKGRKKYEASLKRESAILRPHQTKATEKFTPKKDIPKFARAAR